MRRSHALGSLILALLIGVPLLSGAATAQDPQEKNSSCPTGFLIGETIDGNLTVKEKPCYVVDTLITGKVNVTDSKYFALIDSYAEGKITIKGNCGARTDCYTLVRGSELVRSDLNVQSFEGTAILSDNAVRGNGDINLKDVDGYVLLADNVVDEGNITCQRVDGEVITIDNELRDGTDKCAGIEQ
jgi:hypothetical protein